MSASDSGPNLSVLVAGQRRTIQLDTMPICRIGRAEGNNLVLDSNLISRNHALVQRTGVGRYLLTDLGSRNGTFVNGARIAAHVLRHGDRVTVGDHELTFQHAASLDDGPVTQSMDTDAAAGERTRGFFSVRLVSVLVADIRDFTVLSQRIQPAVLSEMMGLFSRKAGLRLRKQGAWAQKYIGDAVMAVWLHQEHEPTAEEYRKMLEFAAGFSDDLAEFQSLFALDSPLRIGIGLSTGFASLGNLGNESFTDHTAIGETVNLAFRLETATRVLGCDVAVSATTFEFFTKLAIGGCFQEHEVRMKGYSDPQRTFTVKLSELKMMLGQA